MRTEGARKRPQSKVDKALAKLHEEDLATWNELIKFNTNYTRLGEWLTDKGFPGISNQNISSWHNNNRPRGEAAKYANAIAETYQGTNPNAAEEMSIALLITLAHKLSTEIEEGKDEANPQTDSLISALRELSNAATRRDRAMRKDTEKDLRREGKQEMGDKILQVFKGSEIEGAITSVVKALLEE